MAALPLRLAPAMAIAAVALVSSARRAEAACVAPTVQAPSPANNATVSSAPTFKWGDAGCTTYKVQSSPLSPTSWTTLRTLNAPTLKWVLTDAQWDGYAPSWASGMKWRVQGVSGATRFNSTSRTLYADPDVDDDGFTVTAGGDCDDSDAAVFPGAVEECDGLDNDCDGAFDDTDLLHTGSVVCVDGVLDAPAGCEITEVAGTPDLTGDGQDDLALGGPGCGPGGVVYLVPGPVVGDVDLNLATRIYGANAGDRAGSSVRAWDLDNDGSALLCIGAPGSDAGGTDAGAVYCLQGPMGADFDLDFFHDGGAPAGSIWIVGESAGDEFGFGQVQARAAEGGWQLVVTAPYHDAGGTNAGAAYAFWGPFDGMADAAGAAGKVVGNAAGDHLGWAVAAPRMAADPTFALVLGAPGSDAAGDGAGAVYAFHEVPVGAAGAGSAPVTLLGEAGGDHAGTSMAIDEGLWWYTGLRVLVGASGQGDGGLDAGAAYVLDLDNNGVFGLAEASTRMRGAAGDRAGSSVSVFASAVEPQVVYAAGAPGQTAGGVDSGAVYAWDLDLGGTYVLADAAARVDGLEGSTVGETMVWMYGDLVGGGGDGTTAGALLLPFVHGNVMNPAGRVGFVTMHNAGPAL